MIPYSLNGTLWNRQLVSPVVKRKNEEKVRTIHLIFDSENYTGKYVRQLDIHLISKIKQSAQHGQADFLVRNST